MEQLGWLQIGQHQLQQDVTHGLAFVLVDRRDNELDFADLIGVFLLDGYGIFHVGLLPERYETMTDIPPCPEGKRKKAAPSAVPPSCLAPLWGNLVYPPSIRQRNNLHFMREIFCSRPV